MRVLVLSHMYPSTAEEINGLFVHEQVKALIAAGAEVQVVSPVPWAPFPLSRLTPRWKAYAAIPRQATVDGVTVWYPRHLVLPRNWLFSLSGWFMYWGIRRLLRWIRQDFSFDLIHAHVALPDGHAASLLAKEASVPVVVTIHGQDLQHTIAFSQASRHYVGVALTRAKRVVLVSSKLRRLAEQHFAVSGKTTVIGNGVDVGEVDAVKAAPRHALPGSGPQVLSASNLRASKGIDLNLQAVGSLRTEYPGLCYSVIGGGDEAARLGRLVRDLDLERSVSFHGCLPHRSTLAMIAACDIFSLPSWSEGFGVAYLEAMALGKPVIGCRGEGVEDFVEDKVTGLLVEPKDVAGLRQALRWVLDHPEEARRIGERARQVVLDRYTWHWNAEQMLEVYREVLHA